MSLPVHKYASTRVQSILDESIAVREMLQQVLVIDIVDLDDLVRETLEELLVQRQLQNGQNMSDTSLLKSILAA